MDTTKAQGRAAWAETFAPVLQELREQVRARRPEDLAAASGAVWQAEVPELRLPCLGEYYRLSWPDLIAYPAEGDEAARADSQGLLLYYLSLADGTPPANRWIAFRELPDGWLYHQAFQSYTGHVLVQAVGNNLDAFTRAARGLGGSAIEIGDTGYAFEALPHVPLAVVYWQGDDEFPPEAQVLFDAAASHYLTTDGLALLGHRLIHRLLAEVS